MTPCNALKSIQISKIPIDIVADIDDAPSSTPEGTPLNVETPYNQTLQIQISDDTQGSSPSKTNKSYPTYTASTYSEIDDTTVGVQSKRTLLGVISDKDEISEEKNMNLKKVKVKKQQIQAYNVQNIGHHEHQHHGHAMS